MPGKKPNQTKTNTKKTTKNQNKKDLFNIDLTITLKHFYSILNINMKCIYLKCSDAK